METSGSSSGASTRTAAEITATELEVAQLRTKLAAQETAFCDANARVLMLESRAAAISGASQGHATPGPAFASATPGTAFASSADVRSTPGTARVEGSQQRQPEPPTPPPWSINMTPKAMYSRLLAQLSAQKASGGAVMIRQPRFTPAARPIAEEARSAEYDVKTTRESSATRPSSAEHIARGLLEAEREKRVIKSKVTKALGRGVVAKVVTEIVYRTWGVTYVMARKMVDYVGENASVHSLVTLSLLALQSWPVVEPLLRKVIVRVTVAMYGLSLSSAKATVINMRAVLSAYATSIVNMLLGLAIKRVASAQATREPAPDAAQGAPVAGAPAAARVTARALSVDDPHPTSAGDAQAQTAVLP